jgi:hypothetical protein
MKEFRSVPNNERNFMFKVGLSEPYRVGQASEVRIELLDSAPMQIDGEPWEQHPADITITHHKQVSPVQGKITKISPNLDNKPVPYLLNSVGDTDPDPHVFEPPGSVRGKAPDPDSSLFS